MSAETPLPDGAIIKQEKYATENSTLQTALQKIFCLFAGPSYVYGIARVFAAATQASVTTCILVASCASVALVVIILLLSYQMSHDKATSRRFGLSTVLLVMSGLAIFFAPIGVMYRALASDPSGAPGGIPLAFFAYAIVFVPFSTMILVYFVDSVVWFARKIPDITKSQRPPTSNGGRAKSPQR